MELWSKDGNWLEKCVGACSRATFAKAMLPKAIKELPNNRIVIRQ